MKNANTHIINTLTNKPAWPTLLGGLIAGLAWGYLAFNSQFYGDASLRQLLLVSTIAAASSLAVYWYYRDNHAELSLTLVLLFALAYRLIGLFTFPVLEDDFYRFLWDGFQTASIGSPYTFAPSHFFGAELNEQFEHILDGINYPDSTTIYGPSAQWLFYLAYQLAPGELWPLKILFIIADGLIILLLLKTTNKPILLLYAWSPLVIKEFVISLHPDLIGVLFMVLAIMAYRAKHDFTMGALLALALGIKLFAIIIVPFLILHRWKGWLGLVITALAIAWPFGVQEAWLPAGLSTMSSNWLFNAPLYELLLNIMPLHIIKVGLLALFVGCGAVYGVTWWLRALKADHDTRPIPRGDYLFMLFFLCLPAFNPWYAIWLIPFVLKWPAPWVMVGSISLMLAYASGINLDIGSNNLEQRLANYQHPAGVLIIEFGTIALAFVLSDMAALIYRKKRPMKD